MDSAANANDYGPVSKFYHGKSIFVTGGTGFVGKVLIEKLLWSCPGLETIYVLMRPKKNKDVPTRLTEMLNKKVFERLRNSRPSELEKIVPVIGDLSAPSLGLSPTDKNVLLQTVSVVFHVGATVRFNETIKQCIVVNVKSTKTICELCHDILHLQALVYISTAFSNCDRTEIKETIYSLPNNPDGVIDFVDAFDEDAIGCVVPMLLGERPNVYTYSKALAENILDKESKALPIAIVRPSIVMSSAKEPAKGWTDSWGGLSPYSAAVCSGVVRRMFANPRAVADFVPVDMVANLTISVAWHTALKSRPSTIDVYNLCSGLQNPITWGEFAEICDRIVRANPVEGLVLPTSFSIQSNWIIYRLQTVILEKLPLIVVDWMATITGKTTKYAELHSKLVEAVGYIRYFVRREWKFEDNNVKSLYSSLEKKDKETFPFLVKSVDWNTYFHSYALGICYYLLKKNTVPLKSVQMQNIWSSWVKILLILFAFMYIVRIV